VRDPFEQLRDPVPPADPDPPFAEGLRDRLERALDLPRGVVPMTDTETDAAVPRPGALPYLSVDGARAALDWYEEVFGATVVGDPVVMDDGRIGHAELAVGNGVIYLADPFPDLGLTGPRPGETSVSLMLAVDDADEIRRRALSSGATSDRDPYDGYGRRNAWITDPFGHRWGLNSPLRG
jgi:uncharacterized glyoxalase superfamily protein PhnB